MSGEPTGTLTGIGSVNNTAEVIAAAGGGKLPGPSVLKKTSALATETETTATPPAGVVGFFSQEDPTNFASPKLAAKHNHALALAAVSTRHHQQPTASSVVQKTEQQNDK